MLLTGLCFVGVNIGAKYIGGDLPAAESAFLRFVLGLVFIIPVWKTLVSTRLTRQQWKLFTIRGIAHTAAVTLWFFAMAQIPMAEVTALNYMNPIYVTLGAALFLGEKLAFRRLAAIGVAMIGALIILRPGLRELEAGHFAMLISAACFAVSYLVVKRVSSEVPPAIVVAILSISLTIGLAPLAIAVWVPPTLGQIGILFVVAALATLAHYSMTKAFAAAPLTVTQPVVFLQLVWAVIFGVILFDEQVDIFVIGGGALIIAAISFMTWREAVLRKKVTPVVGQTKV
jgi:drug/metabolite transporter (DMT)-like permease